jgi:hypothetical protein
MTPEALSATAGIILSALMTYIPGLNVAFASLSPTTKRLTMVGCLIAAAIGTAAWTCTSPEAGTTFGMCMSGFDWRSILMALIAALVANQSADRILPKPEAVKEASEESHRVAEASKG